MIGIKIVVLQNQHIVFLDSRLFDFHLYLHLWLCLTNRAIRFFSRTKCKLQTNSLLKTESLRYIRQTAVE